MTTSNHLKMLKIKLTQETSHSCSFCEFWSTTEVGLASHMKKHKGAVKYKCEDCEDSFHNPHLLFKHSLKQHNGLKCNKCENRYVDQNCYRRHVKIEHEGLRYECKLCGKKFRDAQGLKNHRNSHLGIKPFMCDKCDSAFTNSKCLRRHMNKMHKVCEVICVQCGKEMESEAGLRKHMKHHQSENKAVSNSKDVLSKHVEKQHEIENKVLCNECGKELNSKSGLLKHMKLKHVDLPAVDASILREHLKDRVLSFAKRHTVEDTARKFNLKQTLVVKWLKKAFPEKWRLEKHQKEKMHVSKMGRHQEEIMLVSKEEWEERQQMKSVKLAVTQSLEEMSSEKYTHDEKPKIDQSCETIEENEDEAQEYLMDKNDGKEEVEDEMLSPCPSPCPSPKKMPDETELQLKEVFDESMFEHFQMGSSGSIFDDIDSHGEDDGEAKIEPCESKTEEMSINTNATQIFYCDLCEYQSDKLRKVRKHMSKKHEGASFLCTHCALRFKTRYDLKTHCVKDHNMLHLLNM